MMHTIDPGRICRAHLPYDRAQARAIAKVSRRDLHAVHCAICGHWHVTDDIRATRPRRKHTATHTPARTASTEGDRS